MALWFRNTFIEKLLTGFVIRVLHYYCLMRFDVKSVKIGKHRILTKNIGYDRKASDVFREISVAFRLRSSMTISNERQSAFVL